LHRRFEKYPVIPDTQPELIFVIGQCDDIAGVRHLCKAAYRVLDSNLFRLVYL
jgi:uncharacterized membrane protein YkvA (DUF1232 family)